MQWLHWIFSKTILWMWRSIYWESNLHYQSIARHQYHPIAKNALLKIHFYENSCQTKLRKPKKLCILYDRVMLISCKIENFNLSLNWKAHPMNGFWTNQAKTLQMMSSLFTSTSSTKWLRIFEEKTANHQIEPSNVPVERAFGIFKFIERLLVILQFGSISATSIAKFNYLQN